MGKKNELSAELMSKYMQHSEIETMLSIGVSIDDIVLGVVHMGEIRTWDDFLLLYRARIGSDVDIEDILEMLRDSVFVAHFEDILKLGERPVRTFRIFKERFRDARVPWADIVRQTLNYTEYPCKLLPLLDQNTRVELLNELIDLGLAAQDILESVEDCIGSEQLLPLIEQGAPIDIVYQAAKKKSFWKLIENVISVYGITEVMRVISQDEIAPNIETLLKHEAQIDYTVLSDAGIAAMLNYLKENEEYAKDIDYVNLIKSAGPAKNVVEKNFDFFVQHSVDPKILIRCVSSDFIVDNAAKLLAQYNTSEWIDILQKKIMEKCDELKYTKESFNIFMQYFEFGCLVRAYNYNTLVMVIHQIVKMPDFEMDTFLTYVGIGKIAYNVKDALEFLLEHGAKPSNLIPHFPMYELIEKLPLLMEHDANIDQVVKYLHTAAYIIDEFDMLRSYGASYESLLRQCEKSMEIKLLLKKILECDGGFDFVKKLAFTDDGHKTLIKISKDDSNVIRANWLRETLYYAKSLACEYATLHPDLDFRDAMSNFNKVDTTIIFDTLRKTHLAP